MRSKVKASKFVAKAVEIASEYKTVYMWGTFGAPLSEKVIRQKAEQYPSHYGSTKQRYLRAKLGQGYFAFDCVGLIKGILWGWSGDGSKNYGGGVYAANGVPDTNVGGMMKLCTEVSADWSGILPGELVATSDHIGIYIGGGKVAEATPAWEDGVQISACANMGAIKGLNSRKWDRRGKLQFIDYTAEGDETGQMIQEAEYLKSRFGIRLDGIDPGQIQAAADTVAAIARINGYSPEEESEYNIVNGMIVIQIPVSKFKIQWWDKPKRTTVIQDYFNLGYFAEYSENGKSFTLPVANLLADIYLDQVEEAPLKYLREWGKIENNKVWIDCRANGSAQFKGKSPHTLVVYQDGTVSIDPLNALPSDAVYAVAGAPVMIGGADTSYSRDVLGEGWDSSIVRPTWHGFLGLKGERNVRCEQNVCCDGYIYYIGMKTTTSNCFSTSEVYRKLSPLGFRDVIKVDGGGSYILDKDGVNAAVTEGNRRVNNLGRF